MNGLKTLQVGAWQDGCVGFEKTQHVRLQGEQTLKASSFHCEMRASEPRITADNQEVKRLNRNQSEPWNFRVMDTDGRTFEQRSKITPSEFCHLFLFSQSCVRLSRRTQQIKVKCDSVDFMLGGKLRGLAARRDGG